MARLGIDISHYNEVSDWNELAKGIDFVFIKATDGDSFIDPKLAENTKGALGAGLNVGFYHFFRDEKGVKAQADFLVKELKDNGVDFNKIEGIVLDDEVDGAHLTQPEMSADVQAFRAEIKALTGKDTILYSSTSFLLNEIGQVDMPVWLADYTANGQHVTEVKAKGFNVKYVQYSDQGHVSGVDGAVDVDKDLTPEPTPKPKIEVPATYIVKAGDTLGEICAHYGVDVDSVAKWSAIEDPNVIHVGQIIKLVKPSVNQVKPKTDVTEYEVIRSGESLTTIALAHGTTVNKLLEINPQIKNRNVIYAGLKIRVQ